MLNGRLIAFPGTPLGLLGAPTQRPYDPPDVARMIPDAGDPGDNDRHAGQTPQVGIEAVGAWPLEQGPLDLLPLSRAETRLAPGATGRGQPLPAALLPPREPDVNGLACDGQAAGNLRLPDSLSEQPGGRQAPTLHAGKVSPGTIPLGRLRFHAHSMHQEPDNVNLLCETQ